MALVSRLTERNLEASFSQTLYLLLRVDRFSTGSFQLGLAEYFDHRFPRLFGFAFIARGEFTTTRLAEILQTATGPVRGGVKDGYYLLEGGCVVGYHMGPVRSTAISYGTTEELTQRKRILASPVGAMSLPPEEIEALRHLVAYFEPIVERKQREAGFSSGYVYEAPPKFSGDPFEDPPPSGARQQGRTGGTPAPAPGGDDPYQVLGIPSSASDEEVKKAYRHQLKLNHPDKVAHLSPALQAFAQQQTLLVNQAYETIVSLRGMRR